MKVKKLLDIKSKHEFDQKNSNFINLSFKKIYHIPLTSLIQKIFVLWSIWFFALGSVTAPTISILAANDNKNEERQALEAQLQELEKQMADYESQIQSYQKQGKTLKNEINSLNAKIAKLNLEIQAINLSLNQLNQKINETENQIDITEKTINQRQQALIELLKKLYTNDNQTLLEIFLKNPKLSDFFNDLNKKVVNIK